jgi:acetyl esterase/lipase
MVAPPMSFHPALPYSRAHPALELDVLTPHSEPGGEPPPVAIFFHGGGWHEGDRGAGMHPASRCGASRREHTSPPTWHSANPAR